MEKRQAIELLEYLRQDRNLEGTIYGDALNMAIEALKAQLSKEGATKGATSDLISRTATIDAVNNAFDRETLLTGLVRSIAVRAIRDMPSAQPEPKEGYWIDKGWDGDWAWQIDGRGNCWRLIECSECGKRVLAESNYCPNCGAKMKGETDGRR